MNQHFKLHDIETLNSCTNNIQWCLIPFKWQWCVFLIYCISLEWFIKNTSFHSTTRGHKTNYHVMLINASSSVLCYSEEFSQLMCWWLWSFVYHGFIHSVSEVKFENLIWTIHLYLIDYVRSRPYYKAICICVVSAWCTAQGESRQTGWTASQGAKCGEVQNSYAGKASSGIVLFSKYFIS